MLVKTQDTRPERKTYFSVAHGKLVKTENGQKEFFSAVGGQIEGLFQKDRKFNGETVVYWYLDLRDEDTGELYSIGFPYYSNTFKSVILALASSKTLQRGTQITLETYEKDGNTKAKVYEEDSRLDWVTKDLPPIEVVTIGNKKVKDDTKRMRLISQYAIEVGKRLGSI